jgi:hypothetical protein
VHEPLRGGKCITADAHAAAACSSTLTPPPERLAGGRGWGKAAGGGEADCEAQHARGGTCTAAADADVVPGPQRISSAAAAPAAVRGEWPRSLPRERGAAARKPPLRRRRTAGSAEGAAAQVRRSSDARFGTSARRSDAAAALLLWRGAASPPPRRAVSQQQQHPARPCASQLALAGRCSLPHLVLACLLRMQCPARQEASRKTHSLAPGKQRIASTRRKL